MAVSAPKGPFKLVTVNNAPARAKILIGRVVENLKDRYTIDYIGNCESEEEIVPKVTALQPDILMCASMWELETSNRMRQTAESFAPGIKTHAIPFGMQVEQGPDAVVAYLTEQVPKLLE